MENLSDILVLIASFTASGYCLLLSKRLKKLTKPDDGIGKEITALSTKIEAAQQQIQNALETSEQPIKMPHGNKENMFRSQSRNLEINSDNKLASKDGTSNESSHKNTITPSTWHEKPQKERAKQNATGKNNETPRLPSLRK